MAVNTIDKLQFLSFIIIRTLIVCQGHLRVIGLRAACMRARPQLARPTCHAGQHAGQAKGLPDRRCRIQAENECREFSACEFKIMKFQDGRRPPS